MLCRGISLTPDNKEWCPQILRIDLEPCMCNTLSYMSALKVKKSGVKITGHLSPCQVISFNS